MLQRYPCGQCDLDFNLKIKLNRHVARVHSKQTIDEEPFFLKADVDLTNDEKLKYFDDLKSRFDKINSKYANYEKRYGYLQSKLITLNQHRNKPKAKQVTNFRAHYALSGSYEDIKEDKTVPEGWKSSYKNLDAFGKNKKHIVYWAPNGRFCNSRREALNYMVDIGSSKEEIEIMKNGLRSDGWTDDPSLPIGWLSMASERETRIGQMSLCKRFITADFQLCKNAKIATRHILMNNSEQELSKFISSQFLKSEVTPSNITWLQNDNIPYPWKAATTTSDLGSKGQLLITPEGVIHTNIKSGLEFAEKSGELKRSDVEQIYSFLGESKYKEELSSRDWIQDKTLPAGWMKLNKAGHGYYLSPKGDTFGTRIGVLEHLKKTGTQFDETPFVGKNKIDLVWKEDDTAPEGWTSALNEGTEHKTERRFKDPNGKYFFSRIEALKYLTRENGSEENIATMKTGLLSDGWSNEHLPSGWFMKNKNYLSPTFEMIYSMEIVIAKMRESGVSEEDLVKVKEHSILKWESKDYLPQGWMVCFNTERSWIKHYMDPNGKFFLCLPQALKHLTAIGNQEDQVARMRPILFDEGWENADFLPTGWLFKKKIHNRFMFLSPTYERFKNTKFLVKYLREIGFKQDEITKCQKELKAFYVVEPKFDLKVDPKVEPMVEPAPIEISLTSNDISQQRISSLKWVDDESLPEGWSIAETEVKYGSSEYMTKRFLSPKGSYFGSRAEAYKSLLMDASSETVEIAKMKSGLLKDGWESADFMPENWLRKVPQHKSAKATYLTPTGHQIQTLERVLSYMKENGYSDEVMDKFKENSFCTKYLGDETLPSGWKCGFAPITSGFTAKRYLSPEGKLFNNRALAMKYMLANKINSEDIIQMKKGFDQDGWTYSEYLPEGWKMKKSIKRGKVQYLTPSYDTINGNRGLLSYMEENSFSKEQVNRIKRFLKISRVDQLKNVKPETAAVGMAGNDLKQSISENLQSLLPGVTFSKIHANKEKKMECETSGENNIEENGKGEVHQESVSMTNLDWRKNDSLPAGWKSALMAPNLKTHKTKGVMKFLSSDGKFLNSRAQCLRYMLEKKGKFKTVDIDKMKRSLPKDGWRKSDSLPENWMYRKVGKRPLFLNPKFEQIKSFGSAKKYMENSGYDFEIIEKAKRAFYRASGLPVSSTTTTPEKFEVNRESSHPTSEILNESSSDSVSKIKSNQQASSLEWNDNETLPKGWKCAFIPNNMRHVAEGSKIMKLMSPDGKYLNGRIQALKHMEDNRDIYSKKDYDQMYDSLKEDGWVTEKNLPEGWLTRYVQQRYFIFMSPELETLKSQKKALEYMEEKNYEVTVINKVKAFFNKVPIQADLKSESPVSDKSKNIDEGKASSPVKRKIEDSAAQSSRSDLVPPIKKKNWSKFIKGRNDGDWSEGDDTVPEGWKIRVEKSSNTSQMLSPSGNVFSSREEAFKYMMANSESYSEEEANEMRARLHHEMWEDHHLLPSGWKLKKLSGGVLMFLSERGSCMKTVKGARDNLKRKNDNAAREKLDKLLEKLRPTNRNYEIKNTDVSYNVENLDSIQRPDLTKVKKEKIDNVEQAVTEKEKKSSEGSSVKVKLEPGIESDQTQSSLPPNWSLETSPDGSEVTITSSQGKVFTSRLAAVEFLVKSKSDPKTIYNMWNTLEEEGWKIGGESLPPGWRLKFHKSIFDYKYLSREMAVIHSTEVALKHIDDNDEYTPENVDKFKKWSEEVSKSRPKINWVTEVSLPSGWVISCGLSDQIIKDSKGSLYIGRKEAIDVMIKEHYSPSEIFSLWNTLHLEGWITDEENLPTGWKRKFFNDLKRNHYLSPMMEVVKSSQALLNIVENGKEYTFAEVNRVKIWMKSNK